MTQLRTALRRLRQKNHKIKVSLPELHNKIKSQKKKCVCKRETESEREEIQHVYLCAHASR